MDNPPHPEGAKAGVSTLNRRSIWEQELPL